VIRARDGKVTLLYGGMGTALLARGLEAGLLPEHWVVARPWEVEAVHRGHLAAGAEVLLTCTFNLARLDLAAPGLDAGEVARRAVGLARAAGARLVAGCVGATGFPAPDPAGQAARHGGAFRALAAAGVDLLWSETQLSLAEARAALAAGRGTGLPVVATAFFQPAPGGLASPDGTPALPFLEALWREGAAAVGVNCVTPDDALVALVGEAAARLPIPLVVKPNAGLPGAPLGPEAFAAGAARTCRAGASLAGGCCGAGPAHLRALRTALRSSPAQARG
jgi:5-methyltetrahydrofolate--homocysteine methyltransferase